MNWISVKEDEGITWLNLDNINQVIEDDGGTVRYFTPNGVEWTVNESGKEEFLRKFALARKSDVTISELSKQILEIKEKLGY